MMGPKINMTICWEAIRNRNQQGRLVRFEARENPQIPNVVPLFRVKLRRVKTEYSVERNG